MGKIIQIEVPDWIDDNEIRRRIEKIIATMYKRGTPVKELRKILRICDDELSEELETYDVEEFRNKERERLKW